jgi:hypothetical protein
MWNPFCIHARTPPKSEAAIIINRRVPAAPSNEAGPKRDERDQRPEIIMLTQLLRGAGAVLLAVTAISVHPQGVLARSPGEILAAPGEPVMLTDAQRAKILRALSLNGGAGASAGKEREISEPNRPLPSRALPTPSTDELAVGSAVPQTLPLTPVPDSLGIEVPAVRRLTYAVVNGKVLLVEPTTSLVLSEIDR